MIENKFKMISERQNIDSFHGMKNHINRIF